MKRRDGTQWLGEGKPQPCVSQHAAGTQTLLVLPVHGAASADRSLSLQKMLHVRTPAVTCWQCR